MSCGDISYSNLTLEMCDTSSDEAIAKGTTLYQTFVAETLGLSSTTLTPADCYTACELEECADDGNISSADLALRIIIQILVFALVFGLAGSVDFDHFKQRFRSKGIWIGVFSQFVLMPLIGFATVAAFRNDLEPLYAIVLIIICASPGGSYSNWWCNLINADLALSVAMTTVSTILSVAMLPLNIYIYVEFAYKKIAPGDAQSVVNEIPWTTIGYTLAVVISAVILGMITGIKAPQYMKSLNRFGTACGFLSIILGSVISSTSCNKPWDQPVVLYIATAVPIFIGLAVALGFATLAQLPKPQRVAVAIETAYQNTGIALAITLSLGPTGRAAAVVPVGYGFYEAIVFGIFAIGSWYIGWTLSPSDANLCVAFLNEYQDEIDNHHHYVNEKKMKGSVGTELAASQDTL